MQVNNYPDRTFTVLFAVLTVLSIARAARTPDSLQVLLAAAMLVVLTACLLDMYRRRTERDKNNNRE